MICFASHNMCIYDELTTMPISVLPKYITFIVSKAYPDSKVHGANVGPVWGRQDPGGPHVGPMDFSIRVRTTVDDFLCQIGNHDVKRYLLVINLTYQHFIASTYVLSNQKFSFSIFIYYSSNKDSRSYVDTQPISLMNTTQTIYSNKLAR